MVRDKAETCLEGRLVTKVRKRINGAAFDSQNASASASMHSLVNHLFKTHNAGIVQLVYKVTGDQNLASPQGIRFWK